MKTLEDQSDQLGKMSWRGIHFDLKEGHLEGHLALNVASPASRSATSCRTIAHRKLYSCKYHVYPCIPMRNNLQVILSCF